MNFQPWQVCVELAWEAYCAGSLPIASVITDSKGKIIATGRNRIYEDAANPPYLAGTRLAHAEVNALLALKKAEANYRLYTTTEPCPLCMGAARMMGILEIHFASRDPLAGCADMAEQVPYLKQKGMKIVPPFSQGFEDCLVALQFDRMLKEGERLNTLFQAWEQVLPAGTKAGKYLFASKTLESHAQTGCSAQHMFETIHRVMQS